MKFTVNNTEWEIVEKPKKELIDIYSEQKYHDEDVLFVFGLTSRANHVIYINQDMCEEQKIKTLKHELTHCYIWMYGLYNAPNFNEEMACDIVASSNDFINEVVEEYKNNKQVCHVENKSWGELSDYEKELIIDKINKQPLQITQA